MLPQEHSIRNQFDHLSSRVRHSEDKIEKMPKNIEKDIVKGFDEKLRLLEARLKASIDENSSITEHEKLRETLESSIKSVHTKFDSSSSSFDEKMSSLEAQLERISSEALSEISSRIEEEMRLFKKQVSS